MIDVRTEGIVLEKTEREFENQAVLNPSCVVIGDITHMFYRAVREGNHSTIGYCKIKNGKVTHRNPSPLLFPEHDYESQGLEDPRITFIDNTYYLFYTAFDGTNARIAYATSNDLVSFKKHGLLFPDILCKDALLMLEKEHLPEKYAWYAEKIRHYYGDDVLLWDKDAFIFPRRINGDMVLVHRIMPGIQLARFKDFSHLSPDFWHNYIAFLPHHLFMEPRFWYESRKIGGGCPPIETPDGWLFIYHGVENNRAGKFYHASVALLDLEKPERVIARLPEPLFSPTLDWEKKGDVSNVVFPSSAHIEDGNLLIYYGAADSRIGLKSVSVADLVAELLRHKL